MNKDEKTIYDILFVEDEDAIRNNYIRYLKRYFTNVYEAKDGEEAYHIYKEKKPHILIVDINIPKLNGLDLLEKIRKKDHTTKAIMLTAHSDTNYLLQAAGLKLTKYLIKPISREELKGALNLVIEELSIFTTLPKKTVQIDMQTYWDYDTTELISNKISVLLTNKERKILTCLFSNLNNTSTYDDLIVEVWYSYEEDKINALKTIIKNLRKKLPKNTIKNIYGLGYKIIL